jgi:hypothetical protein
MSGVLAAMLAAAGGAPGVIVSSLPNGSNTFSCDYQFDNNGNGHTGDGAGGALAFTWVSPQTTTVAAMYDVKVDVTSGAWTSGTTGTWLNLGTTRGWVKSSVGTVIFTVSFRETATGIVRGTLPGVTVVVS